MIKIYQQEILDFINQYLTNFNKSDKVVKGMSYALNNGGKRVRPALLLSLLNDLGIDYRLGIPAASAIEMIHTYSLVHDDLPAMDDDDYRRGALTVHKMFDEATAILVGDALLTEAFNIAINDKLQPQQNLDILKYLSTFSGASGMILGQEYDLASENKDLNIQQLNLMHRHKTGKLLALPLLCAAIIAKREDLFSILEDIGIELGLAFQIQDDIFDSTKSFAEMGKAQNSDSKKHKFTYLSLMDIDQATRSCDNIFLTIEKKINTLNLVDVQLSELIDFIRFRPY